MSLCRAIDLHVVFETDNLALHTGGQNLRKYFEVIFRLVWK